MNPSSAKRKPLSFSRSQRITKKVDFLRLRKNSAKWVARHWVLFYCENKLEKSRLAVTLSARYGSAVQRNLFRRWLREKFRLHQNALQGYDLHFIAKQKPVQIAKTRYKDELNEDFAKLLHRFS